MSPAFLFVFLSSISFAVTQPPPISSYPGSLGRIGVEVVAFSYNRGFISNTKHAQRYISFQKEVTNVNADFRKEYGTFVCQEPGIYFFMFSALSNALDDYRIALKHNYNTVATAYASKLDYTMSTQHAILSLNRGDIVYLQVEEGNIFESSVQSRAYASFSGYMVTSTDNSNKVANGQMIWMDQPNQPTGTVITVDPESITLTTDIWKLLGLSQTVKK